MNRYLAVDMGASTVRMILGWVENGTIQLQEVYRAPNNQEVRNGHLCWKPEEWFNGIVEGLKKCKELNMIPTSMGIDTWGVDYVLLDENDKLLGDAVAYRDSRTEGMDAILEERLPFEKHYAISGIAKQPYNTVYQLMAQFREHPEHADAKAFLMTPSYLNFLLTGVKRNEYTLCSTTGLLDAATGEWSREILEAAEIPAHLFEEQPCKPGTAVGNLRPELVEELGFDVTVIAPATHDTGSAFVAVPARDENAVYLSSGTWSLLGLENDVPLTTADAMGTGFTNEGGYNGKIRYLKNIMGLWILQSIHKELDGLYGFGQMAQMAESADGYPGRIDVNDNRFLAPKEMLWEISSALKENGFANPTLTELLSCVNHSLADCYAKAISDLEKMVGRKFTSVNIVGGGCQNEYLNQLTAKATGLPVYAGPTEGTALGNLVVQMLRNKEFSSLQEARNAIAESFEIKEILP